MDLRGILENQLLELFKMQNEQNELSMKYGTNVSLNIAIVEEIRKIVETIHKTNPHSCCTVINNER